VTTTRHDKFVIAEFLDAEYRQVWAVDRHTGEPHYLPEGEAVLWREVAKREWRCPYPDCTGQITTVGPHERRHHFRHNAPFPHGSDRESEFHLQAKAMLAAWARDQFNTEEDTTNPAGLVREEETLKVPHTRVHRRADVMATFPDEKRVAFEVEYKPYPVADWQAKQAEYESQHVTTTWLFGHLGRYLSQPSPPPEWPEHEVYRTVHIKALPRVVGAHGLPVLHINPVHRMIGTVVVSGIDEADDPKWWKPAHTPFVGARFPREDDHVGELQVDLLNDCRLDPALGLVTPTMDRVLAEVADREQRADRLRAEAAARAAERDRRRRAEAAALAATPAAAQAAVDARTFNNQDQATEPEPAGPGGYAHHCGQCAYRHIMGLPVTQSPT
jgi:hypothetical protein